MQAWTIVESHQFVDNWHIHAICDHLQAVTEGGIDKLVINVPPGCSKSLLTCVFWPAWEWIRDQSIRWFFASYDQKLATRDSVKMRNLITSDWYQARWPVSLSGDANQKTYYTNTAGGYRLATSTGGHGTGEHPDRIVVDDPHNVQQAESEKERQEVTDWWDLTMSTRGRSRGAKRVGIMQRLHEDDWTGHVLKEGDWEHMCLPMRFEFGRQQDTCLGWNDPRTVEGELLCQQQFPLDVVEDIEKSLGAYGTAGQFQQRPHPKSGGLFKRPYFKIVPAVPAIAQRVRFWDKAGSALSAADWTVGVLMAKTAERQFFVEDVRRGQWEPHDRDKVIIQQAELDRLKYGASVTIGIEQEPGNGGKQSAQISVRELAGYSVFIDHPSTDKEVRATPFASQCGAGNVYLVAGSWNQAYIDELIRFPNGRNDDQVDASSGAFNNLTLRQQVKFRRPVAIGGK